MAGSPPSDRRTGATNGRSGRRSDTTAARRTSRREPGAKATRPNAPRRRRGDRTQASDQPWTRLDPALADVLAPELPAMVDEIIAEIAAAIPEYRRPLEGSFGRGLRIGVQQALGRFLALIGGSGEPEPGARDVYAGLGRGELRAGRGLDALQAAYRVGARVAWRRVSDAARAAGADPATISLLAESIFAYIDEISAASVEGYARLQAANAGERQRRRERLVRLLVAEDGPDEAVIPGAAADAGWPLPATVAALATAQEDAERLVGRLGPDAIAARVGGIACVLVPDASAPGRGELLTNALAQAHHPTAVGPGVPVAQAHVSFSRARQGLRLQEAGVLLGEGPIFVEEHLGELVLFGDPALADELARRRLEPLDRLAVGARTRLTQTLAAWLRHQGSVPAVAADLHVHRQTVRYRLARLRELFGAALEDPDARFELELALRASRAIR